MFKIGDKLTKENYTAGAIWCNANNCTIDSDWIIVATPKPTKDEMQAQVRAVRNQFLKQTDKFLLADYPVTGSEREQYKAYRSYLRDYTKTEKWYLNSPVSFEEWQEIQSASSDNNAADEITPIDSKNNEIGEENAADGISETVDNNTDEELPAEPENETVAENASVEDEKE